MIQKRRFSIAAIAACLLLTPAGTYAHEASESKADSGMQCMRMMMSTTGDPDENFARNMIKHHQMAIDMSRMELEKGSDKQIRSMAGKIIEDQQKEIEIMEEWLNNNQKRK